MMSKYTEIEVLGKAAREFWEVARNAANLDDDLSVKARKTATMCVDEAGILLLSVSEDREASGGAILTKRRIRGLTDDAEGPE